MFEYKISLGFIFFLSNFNLFSINIFVLRLKENVLLSLNGKITGTRIYDIYFKNIETVANWNSWDNFKRYFPVQRLSFTALLTSY